MSLNKSFPAKEWRIGDELIQSFDVFEIIDIRPKSWGKIPMSIIHKTFNAKADERCPGIPGLVIQGDEGWVQINPDYDAEPDSYLIKRVFRGGEEIWRA